ncbi:dynein regulatory complex protein 10 [Plectropomus leopardus]|uniref:dynein regulatory complex protein 10 n=1 Tax=Plectropomus leopardus TaxID=160734 RepID=UPI001C4C4383|nr:dynein regulatory complex protein 10 [Plectropomus leopardus]
MSATVLAKNQPEDALKIQELSQRKLLSPEAQHISNILKNCISQVETAATLPAVLLNSMSSVVDKELSRALQKHQILHERLESLMGLKQESGEGQEEVWEARMRAQAQLETDIKNSVRDLLRIIQARPHAVCGLRSEPGVEVGKGENILIRGLKKFHSHVEEKLLLTNLDEEELELILHKQVSSSFAQDLERVVSLEEGVAAAIKEIDAEISQANADIKNLQSALKGDNRQEEDMLLLADKQCQIHIKSAKMKHASMQQDINQLTSQFNNMILEDRQTERVIQEKNEKVETEIEYLLQTFDDEIQKYQANLELVEMDYERNMEELRKLEKPFSDLEVECNQILEKRRLAEEKRKEDLRELELKTKAAVMAQAWWRGYSTRKALKNKGKSKKAKKGKSKKNK